MKNRIERLARAMALRAPQPDCPALIVEELVTSREQAERLKSETASAPPLPRGTTRLVRVSERDGRYYDQTGRDLGTDLDAIDTTAATRD